MACFVVSAAEAIVVTTAKYIVKHQEKKNLELKKLPEGNVEEKSNTIPWSKRLKWLEIALWGGSALLMFEHIWHGEVVPFFPFLTAAQTAEGLHEMLMEMATVGTTMAAAITAVWGIAMLVLSLYERRQKKLAKKAENI